MKWYKHKTGSHDDPDISDAWDEFGDFGYVGFFVILELYGDEFNHINDEGFITISKTFLRRKLRKSWAKVELLLNFYLKCGRILSNINGSKVSIKVPNFIELSDNWTGRKLRSDSVVTTAIDKEEDIDKDKDKKENIYKEKVDLSRNAMKRFEPNGQEIHNQAKHVLSELNRISGNNISESIYSLNPIEDLLRSGKQPEELIAIVEKKKRDPSFGKNHLRPQTLFKPELFAKYEAEDETEYNKPREKKKAQFGLHVHDAAYWDEIQREKEQESERKMQELDKTINGGDTE